MFIINMVLFCIIINAQSINNTQRDSIQRIIEMKKNWNRSIDGQRTIQDNLMSQAFLMDSSLAYNWNNDSNTWSEKSFDKTIYTYDSEGRYATQRHYTLRSTTNDWVGFEGWNINYNQNDNITDFIYIRFDTLTNAWIPYEHDSIIYNNANVIVKETWNFYDKINYSWKRKWLKTYNNNGVLLEEYYKWWDESTYAITSGFRYTYTLNSMDLPTETIYQILDTTSDSWVNESQSTNLYINDTILEIKTNKKWVAGSWQLVDQSIYTYTDNLRSESLVHIWDLNTSKLVPDHRENYSYNPGGLIITTISQKWDAYLLTWINTYSKNYAYNLNNLNTELIIQSWNGFYWVNSSRAAFAYDNANRKTSSLYQSYYGIWLDSQLESTAYNINGQKTDFTFRAFDIVTGLTVYGYNNKYIYDLNNLNSQIIASRWSNELNDWKNAYLTNYYYSIHNTSAVNELEVHKIKVYPNPSKKELHIDGITPDCTITVCDLMGNILISNLAKSDTKTIDISNINTGIYLLKVHNQKIVRTIKFLKQ